MIFKPSKIFLFFGLLAAVGNYAANAFAEDKKVDSTLEFRKIPVTSEDNSANNDSMFDLPDLPIPLANNAPANTQSPAAGTETPAGTSSSAPTQLVVPLPPILDIGFPNLAICFITYFYTK